MAYQVKQPFGAKAPNPEPPKDTTWVWCANCSQLQKA
jgi:hypothetical protein